MIVYKFTSPSGKFYFGKSTKTLEGRLEQHKVDRQQYINHNRPLPRFYAAWKKYPIEQWKKEVITEVCSEQLANELEQFCIQQFNTTDPKFGYNMASGGNGGDTGRNGELEKRTQHSQFMKTMDKNSQSYKARVQGLINAHIQLRNNPEKLKAKRKKMSDATPKGKEHWNFTGYWVVNHNKYETIEQAHLSEGVSRDIIVNWCNKPDRIIKYPHHNPVNGKVGISLKELGYYRIKE